MRSSIFRTLVNMNRGFADAGSIAGNFVDVDGIRRSTDKIAAFRTIKGDHVYDKAALGKSRRLMSSCIKSSRQHLNT